jgi:hypothetical protein
MACEDEPEEDEEGESESVATEHGRRSCDLVKMSRACCHVERRGEPE